MTNPYRGEDAMTAMTEDQAKGERFRREADEWIEKNPESLVYMTEQALLSASIGRRFGMKALVEHVRWHLSTTRTDKEYKLNSNWPAAFARRLIEEHPEIAPYISTRHSVLDSQEVA